MHKYTGLDFQKCEQFNVNCVACCGLWSKKLGKHCVMVLLTTPLPPLADIGSYWVETSKNKHFKDLLYDCYH